jgi:uncharacterized protein YbbC (DUF1343 family)
MKNSMLLAVFILFFTQLFGSESEKSIITGADQPDKYLPLIKGKRVGLVVNNTSTVGEKHIIDFLIGEGIEVKMVFAPEHGFRGEAGPGDKVTDGVDQQTGVKVISLFGATRKPTAEHLKDVDVVIFDIQDVGCRFYTYISTLHYVVEGCAENDKPLIILDRPNPNGDYVAGPILKKEFSSFVGVDPVPIVHGCTVGEMALMINGEKWHAAGKSCKITVIPVMGYTHKYLYSLPVRPSPNLPNDLSIRLYPSLCFFEATSISVGRGTDFPFQVLGGPDPSLGKFTFTPADIPGVISNPIQNGKKCYGVDLRDLKKAPQFTLKYFLDFYKEFKIEKDFLTRERWINLLSGTDQFIKMVREGKSEKEILDSWKPEIEVYKNIRKNYLLYPDFK